MKAFPVELDALLTVVAGVLDARGVLLEANAGFLRLLPADCAQPIGTRVSRFFSQPTFAALLKTVNEGDHAGYRGLMTMGDSAGKTRTLRGQVWPSAGGIRVVAEYDIAELEKLNDAVLQLNQESSLAQHDLMHANVTLRQREVQFVEESLTDVLTGVGNRRKLDQALAAEISRARRGGDPLCAIMSDVDHFKRVNDEYGHGVGDKVLVRLGALLRSRTRATDTVARFGGEEFIVLMPHTSLANAVAKAEQLRGALAAEVIEPLTQPVTSSFGVAELARDEDAASFLARVDAALYQAKEGGRDRVVTAGPRRA